MKYNIVFSHPDYKNHTTHFYMSVYGYYYRTSIMQELREPVMDYLRGRWYDYGKLPRSYPCRVVQN